MTVLQSGDRAPKFTAVDQDGSTVAPGAFNGRKLFVFFYPKANTSG